ncbi:error-prone DNA polymerase [Antarcticirhabdus aurantiaca]|uniref:Error-prone DNA polymerase n=1 Tax=Antarcticirhabdus aurantiaca TaxID=2606717 RepID=A0ACD4NHK0_9HYPH|nr:error-prone DNA polymerase [Antarcticirhabdus aurantiaca]WAJ26266.1 error-prone DNA polymerase [Jeongeuplla avenae]
MSGPAFAELAAASSFSFLRGASQPGEVVLQALALGHAGLGLADRNTVSGVVRARSALRTVIEDETQPAEVRAAAERFRYVCGARLVFADGTPDIIAYPVDRKGWGDLCRILTAGNLRAEKGDCRLGLDDLLARAGDLLLVAMPGEAQLGAMPDLLPRLREVAPGAVWLGAAMRYRGRDRRMLAHSAEIAARARVPLLATNDVLYHHPDRRPLQDVVTCVRLGLTVETAGRRLEANAERHLKPAAEMARLFRDAPQALEETQHLLDRVDFELGQLKYNYPDEPVPPGKTPQSHLEDLVRGRIALRYPDGVPEKVSKPLAGELRLIEKLRYARYFLTIHDIVRFAESQGILCQGRGSAANSVVCFLLGITNVDPEEIDVLFARFVSEERREPPDIDVDFEHERREEVIQHIYERYGRHRAGIAATVITYRPKSAVRDVGKALGLTEDVTARLAATVWGSWETGLPDERILQAGFDPADPIIARAVDLSRQIIGFPRHLSQHVGGFVLTNDRLDEVVPIAHAAMEDRTFIEWNKDDIDELELLKVDILALGMLTAIRKGFELLRHHGRATGHGLTGPLSLDTVPRDDGQVYEMLCRGDSIGLFQVESRAQINMLPRLKPRRFYDIVVQVAIVRPGPIQGDMVHPYLRRRDGVEAVVYPSPSPEHGPPDELEQVLKETLGVPLFQEQAMRLAMVAAKFSDVEANGLRRAMATFRHLGIIGSFEEKMVERMVARGYDREFAQRCFDQIKGFGTYGFPESHAASFAHLVCVSAWIKCHHPAAFTCALLNSQPMGFYAPAQLVRDVREHGVLVKPIDVGASEWDCTLEEEEDTSLALRLGFRLIDGFREDWARRILAAKNGAHPSVEDLMRRAGLPRQAMEKLADADAFRSMGLDRREALWQVRRLVSAEELPLFAAARAPELGAEPDTALPALSPAEHVVTDYKVTRLSLKGHPLAFLRERLSREGVMSCQAATSRRGGAFVRLAGVVLVRQRPGNGKVVFMTIEDETGIANIVIWSTLFSQFRREVIGSRFIEVRGRVQRSAEGVVHVVAARLIDRTPDLAHLSEEDRPNFQLTRADEVLRPQVPRGTNHPRNQRIIPKSRDFH